MAFSKSITALEYHEQIAGHIDHVILDTRSPILYERGHLPHSINIRLQELRRHVRQIPRGKVIVVVCASGFRSPQAADVLVQAGFSRIYYLVDDYDDLVALESESAEDGADG